MNGKTQQQRAAKRRKQDKEDFFTCMDKNNWICQRCGAIAAQMHHGKRKHLHVRHDPQYHYCLCYHCHDWAHRNVQAWDEWMQANPNEVIYDD